MSDIEYNAKNHSVSKRLYEDADGKVVDLSVYHYKEEGGYIVSLRRAVLKGHFVSTRIPRDSLVYYLVPSAGRYSQKKLESIFTDVEASHANDDVYWAAQVADMPVGTCGRLTHV